MLVNMCQRVAGCVWIHCVVPSCILGVSNATLLLHPPPRCHLSSGHNDAVSAFAMMAISHVRASLYSEQLQRCHAAHACPSGVRLVQGILNSRLDHAAVLPVQHGGAHLA